MKNVISALLLGIMALGSFACKAEKPSGTALFTEIDGIFAFNVGHIKVYTLVDAQREGNAGILIGANEELLERYIPADGFMHYTNAFLIKTPTQNILVDTAFGRTITDKMEVLGVEPQEIDAVLITHLHGDHFSGLQKDGEAVFPNAKVYVSSQELEYWTEINVNEGAAAALAPYGSNVETFEPSELGAGFAELLPGIIPIASYGHTPGHTVYFVKDGDASLMIIGDLLHIGLVQFAVPEISATFDVDPGTAATARRQVLEYAAWNNIPLGGMHLAYPGIGGVKDDGGGFRLISAD